MPYRLELRPHSSTPIGTIRDRPPSARRSSILGLTCITQAFNQVWLIGFALSWPPLVFVPISFRVFDILGLRMVDPLSDKNVAFLGVASPFLLVVYKPQFEGIWWGRMKLGEKIDQVMAGESHLCWTLLCPMNFLYCRVSPRQARSFCFGKRPQNHGRPVWLI